MKLTILTTGGTIEKTYNEHEGDLKNDRSVLEEILSKLRLPDLFIRHIQVMNKDSRDMIDKDREIIADAVKRAIPLSDAIIILHGTDTLSQTGDYLYSHFGDLSLPVILTGAMRPYEFRDSDAKQNVIEALLAIKLVNPGIFVVMHNKVLPFPGIQKDGDSLTFRTNKEMDEIGK